MPVQKTPTNDLNKLISDNEICEVFIKNGFTIKEGLHDLKPYVYEAARALLTLASSKMSEAAAVDHLVSFFSEKNERRKYPKR